MDVQKLKNESGLKGSKSSEMASALRNFGQAASNNIAETVSAPVDAIAWALRKAGVPVGDAPVMGSEWMAQKGLTRPTQEGVSKMAGDFVGMVSPLAFEKSVATQLAGALRNVKPSAGLSTEAVGGMDFLKPRNFDVANRDASDIFGQGHERLRYLDPESQGFIDILKKPDGTASVLGLEVPEAFRGQKIGQSLQQKAMQDFPSLQGQISSKAAATTAHRLGRRPPYQPDASIDDVYRLIDENSSVNMVTPKMQEYFNSFRP